VCKNCLSIINTRSFNIKYDILYFCKTIFKDNYYPKRIHFNNSEITRSNSDLDKSIFYETHLFLQFAEKRWFSYEQNEGFVATRHSLSR